MILDVTEEGMSDGFWPLFGIELTAGDVVLQPLRETDLAFLVNAYPEDSEHDPAATLWPDMDLTANRRRLSAQTYWKQWADWTPDSWCLSFRVTYRDKVVGVQSLEAETFARLRTVDSGSWLVPGARRRGIGTAMRTAVLSLAFDHLGAERAISSSRTDNAASLGVSRRLGYVDNGTSRVLSPTGHCELQHLRLEREVWTASGRGKETIVRGLEGCETYFGVAVDDR